MSGQEPSPSRIFFRISRKWQTRLRPAANRVSVTRARAGKRMPQRKVGQRATSASGSFPKHIGLGRVRKVAEWATAVKYHLPFPTNACSFRCSMLDPSIQTEISPWSEPCLVTGLSMNEARELLDWLDARGIDELELDSSGPDSFSVRWKDSCGERLGSTIRPGFSVCRSGIRDSVSSK